MIPSLCTQWATFTPQRLDTLRPDAAEHIGETHLWRGAWVIEDEDSEHYAGQMAWLPDDYDVYFGWVPDEDLTPEPQPVPPATAATSAPPSRPQP